MTDPNILDLDTLKQEVRLKTTPEARLRTLIRQDPALALAAAARRAALPLSIGQELAHHKDPKVRRKLAQNEATDPSVLTTLAADPDLKAARGVAANKSAPEAALKLLIERGDVRPDLLEQLTLPPAVTLKLADYLEEGETFTHWQLEALSPQQQVTLLAHPKCRKWMAFAGDKLPEKVLLEVALDPDEEVRQQLASRIDLDEKPLLLARLCEDPSGEVQTQLAQLYGMTEAQFDRLMAAGQLSVWLALARSSHLAPEQFWQLYDLQHPEIILNLAGNADIPEDMMLRLAQHPDEAVRLKLAGAWWWERASALSAQGRKKKTFYPPAVLDVLRRDPSEDVRAEMLVFLSEKDRALFADDSSEKVRAELRRIRGLF